MIGVRKEGYEGLRIGRKDRKEGRKDRKEG